MAGEGEACGQSRTDDPQPEREGATTGGETRQYIITNIPECKVTIDGYTPFQAHVIAILRSIEAIVKEIRDSLK